MLIATPFEPGLRSKSTWRKTQKKIDAATTNSAETDEAGGDEAGNEEARSLVCDKCGKRFRGNAAAEFHASNTEHKDFSESKEGTALLSEEENKAKLDDADMIDPALGDADVNDAAATNDAATVDPALDDAAMDDATLGDAAVDVAEAGDAEAGN